MTGRLEEQAVAFGQVMAELLKRYQFRDRNETVAYGVSVSQAYALRTLAERGPLTMGALASDLHVTVSTMTRVVDMLVDKRLVRRRQSVRDRRVWRVELTARGRSLWDRLAAELLEIDLRVLRTMAPNEREALIRAMGLLSEATQAWRRAKRDGK